MAIVGTAGPDTLQNLILSQGSQLIQGLGGDDTLISHGSDTLEGGPGNDLLQGSIAGYASASGAVHVDLGVSGPQAVGADQGVDTLVGVGRVIGSAYSDTLSSPSSGTVLFGGGGADSMIGGAGDAVMYGETGDDTMDVSAAATANIFGGDGNDVILLKASGQWGTSSGGAGNDLVRNATNAFGDDGADTITGAYLPASPYGAVLYGDAGDDSLVGTDRADQLYGGAGHNTIIGGGGGDTIHLYRPGEPTDYRDDIVEEAGGRNFLELGGGVYGAVATVDMGAGTAHIDVVSGGSVQRIADIHFSGIVAIQDSTGVDSILGSAGNDEIWAGDGQNTLFGGDGNDLIVGGSGHNQVNGNKGDDSITGRSNVGDWLLGGQGNDLIGAQSGSNIINGNMGNDSLHGANSGDTLRGGQGDDLIGGGSGKDWITGDLGNNTLTGGGGADIFHAGAGHDVVTDFNPGEGDRVEVAAGLSYQASQAGADVQVAFSGGGLLVLQNTQLSSLPSGWIV